MTIISTILILLTLFLLELFYFKIAGHYNIIDKPNHRSSHTSLTIRGGGVIFCLSAILYFCLYTFNYPYFIIGLFLISVISFLDDLLTLNNKIRLAVHLISVGLMFYQLDVFVLPWYWLVIAGIFVIGTINAYNFMDGINGITGFYSLIIIATLYYINEYIITFTSKELLIITGLSLIVFNFFNFRKRAKCFAGDVGSVSIAFIILFLLLQLIIQTKDFSYILLLLVYGFDAVTTIIFRAIRREKITEAHRSHFYQYLVNEKKMPHLVVSSLYGLVQLSINILIIFWIPQSIFIVCLFIIISLIIFLILRFFIEGSEKLLGH